jgi:hypothetical protein
MLRAGSRTRDEPAVLSTASGLATPVVSADGAGAVALVAATSVRHGDHPLAFCSGTAPHLRGWGGE